MRLPPKSIPLLSRVCQQLFQCMCLSYHHLLMRLCSYPQHHHRHLHRRCLPVYSLAHQSVAAACKQLMHTRHNKFKASPHAAAALSGHAPDSSSQQQQSPSERPKVIIITGPTAVGKTKLGLELAKLIGGEIISADSVQVYRGLDIGSDKLPLEQREGVPHHLIDILDPAAEFSAGDFHQLGRLAAEDIISRGKVPIVAGGTGFYLRWFVYGKPSTPASSPESAAKALELIGQAWQQAAAEVAAAQQQTGSQTAPQAQTPYQELQQQLAAAEDEPEQVALQAAQKQCKPGSNAEAIAQPAQSKHRHVHTSQQQQQQQQSPEDHLPTGTPPEPQQQQPSSHSRSSDTQQTANALKLPPVSAEAAQAALQLSDEQRWQVAVDVVQQLGDQESAARIRAERNNWYRLQRVLQILVQNGGKPLSQLDIDTTRDLQYDFRCFFLHRPRLELFDRIIYRVEEMVAGGLLEEALTLLDQGMQANSNVATRAIGYRQALEFMQAALSKGSATEAELHQLIFDIATASRNLVKNQTTWFRDDGMFRWLEVGGRSTEEVLQEVLSELDKPQHEGGCGDSGRFAKQTLAALKRYVPSLKLFNDTGRSKAVLKWVADVAAARSKGTAAQEAAGK